MIGAAIPLDMFTDIIAVHWPENDMTKLDFVGNRYMVRGKDQDLEDVLGNEVEYHRTPSDEQRSWRTADGLDLLSREDDGVTPAVWRAPRRAYLKNKNSDPTKKNPGALNEFLFFNYTIVAEFDRYNFDLAWQQINGRGIDTIWEILGFNNNNDGQFWSMSNAEERIHAADGLPEKNEDIIVPFFQIYSPPREDGKLLWWDGYADRVLDTGEVFGHVYSETQPPSHTIHIHADAIEDTDYFKAVPDLTVYDYDTSTIPINGRMIGATPDGYRNSSAPMTTGTLPVPWGRVRVAMTITNKTISFSFNGSNPVTVTAPPLFAMPRVPPMNEAGTSRLTYFPIEFASVGFAMNLEYYMQFPGIMRCMWLFRKPKPVARLKVMSKVQSLPPANSARWKKPPGQDQPS